MRFVDLLKTTVMLSAGAATMLAIITVIGATSDHDDTLVLVATGWWVAASLIGVLLGRRAQVTAPIGRLLADAKMATMLPEHRPAAVILNRLWSDQPLSYRSWAVQPEAKPFEREFWHRRDVDVHEVALDRYVETLAAHTGLVTEVAV